MNAVNYKGFTAHIERNENVGHIAGINDVIGFHANTVAKLHIAFEEAVDDYLETCKKVGRTPQKPLDAS